MEWTSSQQAAIDIGRRDVLVAAAAGSGKTATLTERVLQTVCRKNDPVDINRLLIVTFTDKAAEELRVRIRKKLTEKAAEEPDNARIRRQLSLLPSASVSTIHSFYGRIIREGGAALGLPPRLRTAQQEEAESLKRRVMDETIDQAYEDGGDGEFDALSLFDTFEKIRPGEALNDVFRELYDEVTSYPEFLSHYEECGERYEMASSDLSSSPYFEYIRDDVKRRIDGLAGRIDRLDLRYGGEEDYAEKYRPAMLGLRDHLMSAEAALSRGYGECYGFFRETPELPKFKPVRGELPFKDECKALRDEAKKMLENARKCFSFNEEDAKRICLDTATLCRAVYAFLKRFDRAFSAEKLELGIMDFSDMERLAYRLVCQGDGSLAERLAGKYDEIYVDEYQDVNAIQDAIFSAVGRNNRFMVGDVKQSIYSFRGSDPTIFSSYRKRFKPYDGADPGPSVIFLSENFRCGKPVIDFTNEVFARVFGGGDAVPYEARDALVFGKKCEAREDVPVNIRLFPGGSDADEAEYAAKEIKRLLRYGKKDDGTKLVPSDIAILCRGGAMCAVAAKALSDHGIGSVNGSDKSFFDAPEILLCVSLLSAVDNPMRDVPLAAVMKSPLFGFTLDELAAIRLAYPDGPLYEAVKAFADEKGDAKCRSMIERLNRYRYKSRSMQTDKFVRMFFRETSVTSAVYAESGGDPEARKQNLAMLYELCRRYESDSFKGLYGFVKYCGEMIEQQRSFGVASDPDGRVTVQTIHGSKGLEYPVVFILGCDGSFNSEHSRKSVISDRTLGIGIRVRGSDGIIRVGPGYRAAVIKRNNDAVRDEACLFYVALTRAKKYLYITASPKKEPVFTGDATPDMIYGCRSFLDFLTASLDGSGGSYTVGYGPLTEEEEQTPYTAQIGETSYGEEDYARLRRIFSFEYPYKEAARLPKKVSVSKLYPAFLDDDGETVDVFADEAPKPLILPDYAEEKEKADAAAAGTATHLFMQFCDLDSAEEDVDAEIKRLVGLGFIKPETAELIYRDEVRRFFGSAVYRRMKAARDGGRLFCREYRFNAELDAADFTDNAERKKALAGEKLLVQGVIDCFFENEDGSVTVLDYKTDRIGRSPSALSEFAEKHRRQLGYYGTAVKAITCRENVSCMLYSFCTGEQVPL